MEYRAWLILTRIIFRKYKDKDSKVAAKKYFEENIKNMYEQEIQEINDLEFIDKVYSSIRQIDEGAIKE